MDIVEYVLSKTPPWVDDFLDTSCERKSLAIELTKYIKENKKSLPAYRYCYGFRQYSGKRLRVRKIYAEFCRVYSSKWK